MSNPPPNAQNNIQYYSAYRGPILGPEGNFHHFARQCDPVHVKNGYWRFSTEEDDRRAFDRGLSNPEEVLKAQDAGEGDYEDVILRWVPGELDESNKPREGSARAHLQSICEERRLLGKSLSFRGAVPLYPLGSTNSELFRHRVVKWGLQKGLLSDNLLSPAPPAQRPSSANMASIPTALVSSSSPATILNPRSMSALALSPTVQETQNRPGQTSQPDLALAVPNDSHMSAKTNPSVVVGRPVQSVDQTQYKRTHPVESYTTQIHTQLNHRVDPSNRPPAESVEDTERTPLSDTAQSLEPRQSKLRIAPEDDKDECRMHGNDDTDDISIFDFDDLSIKTSTPADLFHAQVADLPCMDCGSTEAHTSGCWIDEATQRLGPIDELTTLELKRLVDDVIRFDPVPWTTHFGPPEEIVEDAETQIRGMAEVIRNLDETADDPELQGLDDQSTILLWSFKSIGKVQILQGEGKQNGWEKLEM